MAPRAGWIGVATVLGVLALAGLALGARLTLWPILHLGRLETTLHAASAIAAGLAALLPARASRGAARVGATTLLLAAGFLALSPSALGFAPRAGAFVEPMQAGAYALSGAWLAWQARR